MDFRDDIDEHGGKYYYHKYALNQAFVAHTKSEAFAKRIAQMPETIQRIEDMREYRDKKTTCKRTYKAMGS